MSQLTIPQGDFGFYLNFTIKKADGTVYNLTGYTITFNVWRKGDKTSKYVTGACTIVQADGGTCRYLVVANDFATAGKYRSELQLTKSGVQESTEAFDIVVSESA
jgi:hypothetical protein